LLPTNFYLILQLFNVSINRKKTDYLLRSAFAFTTKGLDQCHKDILTAQLLADVKMSDDNDNETLFNQLRSVLLDWKMLFYMFINLGLAISLYSMNLFLPKIIEDDGSKHPNSELLIAPPYIVSCLATIISSWNAGRLNERSNHLMVLLFIQINGYLYLILAPKYLYIGTIIVGIGVFSSNTLIVSWITSNTSDQTKRAIAIGLINSFGNIGGIISGQIYSKLDKSPNHQGHYIMIGILGFTVVLVLLFKLLLKYENRRSRNLTTIQFQEETVAVERQTLLDKVNFIHITPFFQ
jgi:cyanate permease